MTRHIQITFTDLQSEQQEVLIAHLSEAGFEGFEQNETELKAFISQEQYDKQFLHELAFKYQLQFTEQLIPEQNWNSSWESNFQPVVVDDFVAIRANFHQPVSTVQHEIIITPKMSFGTGHHATTYMMVQQMQQLDLRNKKVFDFGTGTGILAILAEKLDASSITAIDNDDWSIANATENTDRNHCRRIILEKAETVPGNDRFDIILANINKNVILDNLGSLVNGLAKGGTLLLSGLLTEDEKEITEKAVSLNLIFIAKQERNNWICLRFSH